MKKPAGIRVDVIVVLGAAVWQDGEPSPSLLRRVMQSIDLYNSCCSKNVLMTGGVGKYPPAEAIVMRSIAVDHGIPAHSIFVDEQSFTTFESGLNCSVIMKKNNWNSVCVVSDSYHLARSIILFKYFGFKTYGFSPAGGRGKTALGKWIFYHMRELVAIPWYLLKLIRLSKSKKAL